MTIKKMKYVSFGQPLSRRSMQNSSGKGFTTAHGSAVSLVPQTQPFS